MKSGVKHDEKVSILIVSTDPSADQTLSAVIQEERYHCEYAGTLQDAIRKVGEKEFDTILWEVNGRESQNPETLESLLHLNPHIPVIISLSSLTDPDQKTEFLKLGAFDLLAKPYRCDDLKVTFQRSLLVKRLKGKAERFSQKLVESEEHFKTVVQASPDAIVLSDEYGNILSWNAAASKIFGYEVEEVLGQPLTLLMPNRFHHAHQEGLARVRTKNITTVMGHTVELVGLRKDGREFPIELSLSYSLVDQKKFFCGIIRDITSRKETEEALQDSEDRFQLTIGQINDAVFFGDLSGNILWANSQASKLVGRSLKDLIGLPLIACLSAEGAEKAESRLALIRKGFEVPPQVEFEIVRPDGTSRMIEANVTNVIRENIIIGRLLVGRDITSRKESEFALIDRNRMLALDAKIGQCISQSQGLHSLLQKCLETLVRHLDAAFARIWLLEKKEQVLSLKASAGLYTHLNGPHSRIPVGQLKVGQIAAEKKPILTNSVMEDPRIHDREWARRENLVAFAGYPLLRNQEVIGVMGLFSKHPLTEFTLKSLEMVADRITNAIEWHLATETNQHLARLNQQILASAGEGIYGLDHEGFITFVNPAAATMLGYESEELIGKGMHESVHQFRPDGSPYPLEECPIFMALRDGFVHHVCDEVMWRKNGTGFPVEYTSTPILVNGEVDGAVVTFKDISDRKRAEEIQQQYCQQLGGTLSALPGAILVVDHQGQVVYANAKAQLIFGKEQSPIVRRPVHEVLPFTRAEWNRLEEEFAGQVAGTGEQQEWEFNETDRTYSYRLFPISLEGQKIAQTGIVLWDITERKKIQEQLIQTEKLSGLGTLVSGMVHEVRSPMQAIVGYADLILEEDNPLVSKEHAGDLKRVTQHITTILTDFLTYARPSTHEEAIDIDLNGRLREAVKMVQRGQSFGNVEVDQQFTELPPVSIRQGEIDQVFINLIGNAVQSMGGRGQVTLTTAHNDQLVTTKISDTGSGIPPEILGKIFEPFFSTKGKGKGTGMGLSIVQQIVKRYGGQISVESQIGIGTTFTIQLPVSPQHGGKPRQATSQAS